MRFMDDEKNAELRDLTKRFWIGAALTLPVLVLSMAHWIPALTRQSWVDSYASRWMQFVLATPVVWWAGWPFFHRGWRSVATRHLNIFTLIAMGVGAPFLFSTVALLMPAIFPHTLQHEGKVTIYFEVAAVVVVLVLLVQVLELRARSRTVNAIKVAPPPVRQATITGESLPVEKTVGDKVKGGAGKGPSSFAMRAKRIGNDILSREIAKMVAEDQRRLVPTRGFADKVAVILAPVALAVSVLTFALWVTHIRHDRIQKQRAEKRAREKRREAGLRA